MPTLVIADPILQRFRGALDELYGERIERVVLYGSRARGDHRPDSDYDVAVFLRDFSDRWREMDRIIPIVTDILYDNEAFIHAMPHRAGAHADISDEQARAAIRTAERFVECIARLLAT